MNNRLIIALVLTLITALPGMALNFPGPEPGPAKPALLADRELILSNNVVSQAWRIINGVFQPVCVVDRLSVQTVPLSKHDVFRLTLQDGKILRASDFKVIGKPELKALEPVSNASTLSKRFPGSQFTVRLLSKDGNVSVLWRAILRDGSNAIRQEMTFEAMKEPLPIKRIHLVEIPPQDVKDGGTVPGSPLVVGNLFFAYEHPNSINPQSETRAECVLDPNVDLKPGERLTQTCAAGVVPKGQLRRGFLYYIERDRAHPYRPFLHYNAWYDICWAKRKINEAECLRVTNLFGRELTQKRGVVLDSFVWDDGWDDPKTLWRPLQANFPDGFTKILAAAQKYDSTLGFWLSPFGGYGEPAKDRYTYGREQGFEFKEGKFALSGPKYYARFLETCLTMIEKNGSNFFKFDGLTRDIRETEAMLRLTQALRERDPNVFVSITTGTWPSPYWLWYGDSTWRGDRDMGFMGQGSKREQWITYRDGITYKNVVSAAPLYPINSLMNQGIAHARYGTASEVSDSREEIRREIQSFFACGTCLQELYITPEMMSPENWDDLAEAAKWSLSNADVMADTHWIGGDPTKNQVYGWASWSERKAVLALRNPADAPATFTLNIANAFELPENAAQRYVLKSPWKTDTGKQPITLDASKSHTFSLKPFEVLVFDANPVKTK